jgi:hypothetical protein
MGLKKQRWTWTQLSPMPCRISRNNTQSLNVTANRRGRVISTLPLSFFVSILHSQMWIWE